MPQFEIFNTYNKITKQYDVVSMKIQEAINNPKILDNDCLVLLPKHDNGPRPPKPPRKPKITLADVLKEMREGFSKQEKFNKYVVKKFKAIDKRFKAIDKRFNAIDKRFNSIDSQFKAHGWIK